MIYQVEQRYGIKQAAELMSLHRRTIERAIREGSETAGRSGIHPVEQVGRRVLIRASTLERWARGFSSDPKEVNP